ncbi:MAG: DUF1501 domain-containing protein [Acidobacteria bacterium]|nr:DUF1501 domain-containing protein [Acidobacteriota bacterium]
MFNETRFHRVRFSRTQSTRPRRLVSRREILAHASNGFGLMALAGLMAREGRAAPAPHFQPRVKNVIFCYMSGGVSHIDSFDPKPRLAKEAGQPMPVPIDRTMFNENGNIMPSPWDFKNYGQSGIPVSSLFPHMGSVADDLAVIRSMTVKFMEHAQANNYFHSGSPLTGLPSLGAWINYGLGTPNETLPGFVVLGSGEIPLGGINVFGSGFLPAVHQGSFLHPERDEPLQNIAPQEPDARQRKRLDFVAEADREFLVRADRDDQIETAIKNYETAYRMQSAVPELVDLRGESKATRKLYGLDSPNSGKAAYARQCLLARRLVERGVRFVELTVVPPKGLGGGNSWDQHTKLKEGHESNAFHVDQPIAALIQDLKARGLFEDTLVIWSGEFGRSPFAQGKDGRDHNPSGFSLWLAGGGIKGGTIFGATDEYGYRATENVLTIYDLHATILHLLGLDHERLTYRFGGRDFRLTDVHGQVIRAILA